MAIALAIVGCNGAQKVFPATACADPCCGGPTGIDCAEHPNIACTEPGDACSAVAYGCVEGVHYVDAAVPSSCMAGQSDSNPIFTEGDAAATAGDASSDLDASALDAAMAEDVTVGDAAGADGAPDGD